MDKANIDFCPRQCALDLDDERLCRMLSRAILLLSYAAHYPDLIERPMKAYTEEHILSSNWAPWVHASLGNYWWTYELFVCLAQEYNHRFKTLKSNYRKLQNVFKDCVDNIPKGPLVPFINTSSYRYYLKNKWLNENPKWTNRHKPEWVS